VISVFTLNSINIDPSAVFGPAFFTSQGFSILVGIVSFILVQGVATAAMTRAIADNYLGQPVGILDAYRKIGRSWQPLLGALVRAGLTNILLALWFIVPCVGWLTGLGILAFFTMTIIPLLAPIIVLERQRARASLRRAWDLARRRFWWVLGFVFVLFLFGQLVVTGPVALVGAGFQFFLLDSFRAGSTTAFTTLQTVVQSLLSLVLNLFYLPLELIGITLMYFDLRVRTEGFDLTLLAASATGETASATEAIAQAPAPEKGRLVTGKEMGYFVLMTLAVVGLYFVFILLIAFLGMAITAGRGGF
jgi:hypothetical protein